jgi:hypothetical protein
MAMTGAQDASVSQALGFFFINSFFSLLNNSIRLYVWHHKNNDTYRQVHHHHHSIQLP